MLIFGLPSKNFFPAILRLHVYITGMLYSWPSVELIPTVPTGTDRYLPVPTCTYLYLPVPTCVTVAGMWGRTCYWCPTISPLQMCRLWWPYLRQGLALQEKPCGLWTRYVETIFFSECSVVGIWECMRRWNSQKSFSQKGETSSSWPFTGVDF